MNSIIKILYKTNDTFDELNNQYADELDIDCNLIFLIFGAIAGFISFADELKYIRHVAGDKGIILYVILSIIVGAGITVLFLRFFLTYLLYGIGWLIKGKAKTIDIKVVVAYSMIPFFLRFPVMLVIGMSGKTGNLIGVEYWIVHVYYIIIWLWTMKIMIQGLLKFNKYGVFKAIINASFLLIIALIMRLIVYEITG